MSDELFAQGIELMIVGMGTVFAFLTLLVFATAAMSWLVQRWQGFDDEAAAGQGADQAAEIAAITAAIALHRRRG